MGAIKRMLRRRALRKHMLKEIERAVNPKAFLRAQKSRIEEVTGIEIGDKIERLRIIKRIPGYDFLLYWKDKATNFRDLVVMGRVICGRYVYLPIPRMVKTQIEKYKLYNFEPDSPEVRERIERVVLLIKIIAIHEATHIIDGKEKEKELGFFESIKLMHRIEAGLVDENMIRKAKDGLAKIPLREIVAFGTTYLVLGESNVLEYTSPRLREIYDETEKEIEAWGRRTIRFGNLWEVREFFDDNRHMIAMRFLAETGPRVGDQIVRRVLERPPTFEELINPARYNC